MEVKIPKEIKDYKERFVLNLTLRQTVSFILGVFVVAPVFLLGTFKYKWDQDLMGWLAILLGMPVFGIGFFSYNGMSVERFFYQFIKVNFIFPATRKYRRKNSMEEWMDDVEPISGKQRSKDSGEKGKINHT